MPLVSGTEILQAARKGGYAIGAFNTNNLEWTQAILAAAQAKQAPVMIQTSMGAAKYMGGYKLVVNMVKDLMESMNITVPVAIHLDHGSFDGAKAAVEAGFTSVMFDGSHFPFEENVEKSKEIIAYAHERGISVECEVGGIGGEEDGVTSAGEQASPAECATISGLGVDFLAAGIGNIHGKYPANWAGLNFDLLAEIQKVTDGKPLVLHGGSGIPADQVAKAISLGVSKINVNTELQLVFAAATRKYIEEGKDVEGKGYDPRKLLAPGTKAIHDKVVEMIKGFGSDNKA